MVPARCFLQAGENRCSFSEKASLRQVRWSPFVFDLPNEPMVAQYTIHVRGNLMRELKTTYGITFDEQMESLCMLSRI